LPPPTPWQVHCSASSYGGLFWLERHFHSDAGDRRASLVQRSDADCIFHISYLGYMLPAKPVTLYDWDTDETHWRGVKRLAGNTPRDLRHRFDNLETQSEHVDQYITLSRYDLKHQFRDLEH
jgi:hypothetical protein